MAETWSAVDAFLEHLLIQDPDREAALAESVAAGLPAISVSPAQGQLLLVLATLVRARRVLEIGTLGGYSAICLGRALPEGGRVVSLEVDPDRAAVARANLKRAGLTGSAEVRVGSALEILPELATEWPEGFDLVFIDADKQPYPDYWRWALRLSHPGTLIIADNVVRGGTVIEPDTDDPSARAVRAYLELMAAEPRVRAAVVQTVGRKGYDGLALAVVLE